MQVFSNVKNDSQYSLVFIHGWGGNENSLECIARLFTKYSCYLICLSGFDVDLTREYVIDSYILEIEQFIRNNIDNKVVLIGHSFGGKLSFLLKLRNPNFIVVALVPSIVKNPFSFKVFIKIKLYKLCRFLHIPIIKCLKGSRDYQNCSGFLRKTFLNVCHRYLSKREILGVDKGLIIGFKKDKEVNYRVLKKVCKLNRQIKFVLMDGNHFGYLDSLLDIYHIISCFLREYYG